MFNPLTLATSMRRASMFSSVNPASAMANTLRGPKKKKGGGAAEAPASSDIVNIFKGRKDALIYPSDMYPPWVMGLLD